METNQRTSAETRAALHEDLRRWREDSAPERDIKDRCFYATPALLDDADALAGALAEAARYKAALDVAEKALVFYADTHLYEQDGDEQSRADGDGGTHANTAIGTIWEMCPERRWPMQARGLDWRLAVRRVLRHHEEEAALLRRILGIPGDGTVPVVTLAGPAPESPHNRALDSLQALQGAKTANDAGMAQDARTARNTGG